MLKIGRSHGPLGPLATSMVEDRMTEHWSLRRDHLDSLIAFANNSELVTRNDV